MTEEQSLFDPPFQAHSRTSHDAATAIRPHTETMRERVRREIAYQGPLTDQQIAHLLNLDGSSVRPRRIELLRAGVIEAAGEALTDSGRKATLWRAVTA
jgi:predicted ArsR family transcriptional regulator